jgi:hypothetical protein
MKKVTKFEANDGTVFDTEESALAHEKLDDLGEWYEYNKLYGRAEGCRIDWDGFLEWCQHHKEKLKEILAAC